MLTLLAAAPRPRVAEQPLARRALKDWMMPRSSITIMRVRARCPGSSADAPARSAARLAPASFGHVARDLRRADDPARPRRGSARRSARQGRCAPSLRRRTGLEMVEPFARRTRFRMRGISSGRSGRGDDRDRLADDLAGAVAEDALGRFVPARDDAGERLADDRVVRQFDDRGKEVHLAFAALACVNIDAYAAEQGRRLQIGGAAHAQPMMAAVRPDDAELTIDLALADLARAFDGVSQALAIGRMNRCEKLLPAHRAAARPSETSTRRRRPIDAIGRHVPLPCPDARYFERLDHGARPISFDVHGLGLSIARHQFYGSPDLDQGAPAPLGDDGLPTMAMSWLGSLNATLLTDEHPIGDFPYC